MVLEGKDIKGKVKQGVSTIRVRTWTLTVGIISALVLYFLVQVSFSGTVDLITFFFIASLQILVHCTYFPDGELFGAQCATFINNRKAYNEKASAVNEKHKVGDLRKYCKYEYEERKKRYIQNECGAIGITTEELAMLQKLPPEEVKKLKQYAYKDNGGGEKILFFTKHTRKRLYRLLFAPIPVEENQADTILSAIELDFTRAITDEAKKYKGLAYLKKILMATVISLFFAYLAVTNKDSIGFATIVQVVIYFVSLFSTAVLSFTKGETCTKVYKNKYYVELALYIDGFSEYLFETEKFDLFSEVEQEKIEERGE